MRGENVAGGENAASGNLEDIEGGVQLVASQVPPNTVVPVVSYNVVDRVPDREQRFCSFGSP